MPVVIVSAIVLQIRKFIMSNLVLMREADAANYLGLSPKTLARWRWAGKGPVFHKLGSAVRYSVQELDSFVSSTTVAR